MRIEVGEIPRRYIIYGTRNIRYGGIRLKFPVITESCEKELGDPAEVCRYRGLVRRGEEVLGIRHEERGEEKLIDEDGYRVRLWMKAIIVFFRKYGGIVIFRERNGRSKRREIRCCYDGPEIGEEVLPMLDPHLDVPIHEIDDEVIQMLVRGEFVDVDLNELKLIARVYE